MTEFGGVFKGKKVLVLGASGFKGSWLCEWLLKCGADVAGVGLAPLQDVKYGSLFEILSLEKRIKFFEVDIRSSEKLLKVFETFQPQVVFHLAAQAIVSEGFRDPETTFSTNIMGTFHVLNCIYKTPSVECAVVVTSDKCYENLEWEHGYRESDRLGGADPYSASKACAEIVFSSMVRSFSSERKGCNLASARAGNVIGGGDFSADRIVVDAMKNWLENKEVVLRNPKATRPWQHVLEPLSGYLCLAQKLLTSESAHGESFNFGPKDLETHTVEKLVCALSNEFATQNKFASFNSVKALNFGKKESRLLKLTCDKAYERLEWKSNWSFKETISHTASWYLELGRAKGNKEKLADITREQISQYVQSGKLQMLAWSF